MITNEMIYLYIYVCIYRGNLVIPKKVGIWRRGYVESTLVLKGKSKASCFSTIVDGRPLAPHKKPWKDDPP